MECIYCGKPLTGLQRKYCCINHKNCYCVLQWRKRTKQRMIDYLGGACSRCGYNKCNKALECHHLHGKDFALSEKMAHIQSWERIKQELDKCILLCSNCHREIHCGVA